MPDKEQKQINTDETEAGSASVFSVMETSRERRLDHDAITGLKKLMRLLERMNLFDYLDTMQNRKRIIWNNLLAGAARGFGFTIGMTILASLLLFLAGHIVDIPLIGHYVARIANDVQQEMRKF